MTKALFGNGWPLAKVRGKAKAAASDTTPRMPLQATTEIACQGGIGSRARSRLLNKRGNQVAGKTQTGRMSMTTMDVSPP